MAEPAPFVVVLAAVSVAESVVASVAGWAPVGAVDFGVGPCSLAPAETGSVAEAKSLVVDCTQLGPIVAVGQGEIGPCYGSNVDTLADCSVAMDSEVAHRMATVH